MTISKPSVIAALVCVLLGPGLLRAQSPGQWVVPAGFQVTVFADNVENAREMALGPQGTVFVGSMRRPARCTRSSIATATTRLIGWC